MPTLRQRNLFCASCCKPLGAGTWPARANDGRTVCSTACARPEAWQAPPLRGLGDRTWAVAKALERLCPSLPLLTDELKAIATDLHGIAAAQLKEDF